MKQNIQLFTTLGEYETLNYFSCVCFNGLTFIRYLYINKKNNFQVHCVKMVENFSHKLTTISKEIDIFQIDFILNSYDTVVMRVVFCICSLACLFQCYENEVSIGFFSEILEKQKNTELDNDGIIME